MCADRSTPHELEPIVRSYLAAWRDHDIPRCVDFFAPDASVFFVAGTYQGREAIEQWHRDRFAAGLEIIRIDELSVDGDTVSVDGVVSSNRLKAWGIDSLSGTMTTVFEGERFKHVKFGASFPRG